MARSGVEPRQVAGIGVDFTSCTMLPTRDDGTPLCALPQFEAEPHAYVKLWKHHAAQYCADRLNETAQRRGEPWLARYGGRISCEWLIPKIMQIAEEAPHVYRASGRMIEGGDWLVWQLCGREKRSACQAGYKALWHHRDGYPSPDFFAELNPMLRHVAQEKLGREILPLGSIAGGLTRDMARRTGLNPGTPVAVGMIDAHASVPACSIDGPGKMLMIMGTSTCHMMLGGQEKPVPGTCGIVKDGILPGCYGYEAGQSCVGDHFAWFAERCFPAEENARAAAEGLAPLAYLEKKAQGLRPGESGLLALDWWNGVRSPLMNFDLSGLLLGMTLNTRPEEIYRALVEATAYGTRMIVQTFEQGGVPVGELYAAGGIAAGSPMTMQIYADVTGLPVSVSASAQSGALGAAILAAGSIGEQAGGFPSVSAAAKRLGRVSNRVYRPDPGARAVYQELYEQYVELYRYFGCGAAM